MATPDRIPLASLANHEERRTESDRTDLKENRKPLYYQGVFANDRSTSTNGDVTPVSLRPPISGGFLNLPRYVPKYTINPRMQPNLNRQSFVDPEKIQDQKRQRKGNKRNNDPNGVPYFKDEALYTNHDQMNANQNPTWEKKPSTSRRRHDGAKNRPGKRRDCCRGCSCTSPKCSCTECTPLTRRVVCVIVVVAVVAAALAAIALSLYFAYYEQLGDLNPVAVNFTIQGVRFPEYLSDLSNSQTVNVTNALCGAFVTTLQDVNGIPTNVSTCSSAGYLSGSIMAIFNLGIRHKRDAYMNSGNAFLIVIKDKLNSEFSSPEGQFYSAIMSSLNAQNRFSVQLNDVTPGYKPTLVATTTTSASITTTKSRIATKTTSASVTTTTSRMATTTTTSASVTTTTGNTNGSNRTTTNTSSGATVAMVPVSTSAPGRDVGASLSNEVTKTVVVMTTETARPALSTGTLKTIHASGTSVPNSLALIYSSSTKERIST